MALTPSGFTKPFSAIGRDIFIKSFAKTNISQAELNAIVQEVQLTSTVTAIGAFTAGTSDVVNMIIEGKDVAEINAVAGVTVDDVAF
jgi:NCAIR mutase (PurE)-related protein